MSRLIPASDVTSGGATPMPAPAKKRPGSIRAFAGWVRNILAILGGLFLVYHLFFNVSIITSPSMSPTLVGTDAANGDWVLSESFTYHFRHPRRWELVQFRNSDAVYVIKRAVGLPRESISVHAGEAVIDGSVVHPPDRLRFLHYYDFGPYLHDGKQAACGSGYFLLGDSSRDSQDSRFEGPLAPERITGRPCLIVWPISRFGFANP